MSASTDNTDVVYEVREHVAYVTINRPERRNAMSTTVSHRLVDLFSEASIEDAIWAVVLTGAGDQAFCAGADLKEFDRFAREGRSIPVPMTGPGRNVHEVVAETAKPTIAVVNGPAVAGGCELALACDLRIAAEHAFLGMPEAKRGMGANFATVVLPRLVPRAIALEMLYTGEPLSADRAQYWGVYNRVVASADLRDDAEDLIRTIVANAPLSLRRYKEMATKGWELPVSSALRLNVGPNPYLSHDREEGIRAFLESATPSGRDGNPVLSREEIMSVDLTDDQLAIRDAVAELCRRFPQEYWHERDVNLEYPEEFVTELGRAGWLSVLIPEEYGGGGGTVSDAALILETINRSGGSGVPAHAQMYTMGTILRHGSDEQKKRLLPEIAANRIRLQAFGVTEPEAGSDTTRIRTFARREGDHYVVNGSKIWTSRFQHSDYLLLLVRTTPYEDVAKKTDGLSILLVDIHAAAQAIHASPIRTMTAHETNEVFFDDLHVPVENLVGEEGKGFRYILSGLNAERILVTSEVLGDGFWFIDRASRYARERIVFGRPIGQNQGVQFPLAQAYTDLEAASLMRWKAAAKFDAGEQPGFEANAAKLLASKASWAAANAAMDTFGGYGLAEEYGIERKFREARLPVVAPINNNLVLAYIGHQVLGMPKSY